MPIAPPTAAYGSTPAELADAEAVRSGLQDLLKVWNRTRAATGGFNALAGFDYQISQALLEVIRSDAAGGELVLMEVLSDILKQDGGGLIVAQLKKTLSSAAVSKALDELWSIENLARSTTPVLRPRLRYRVQGARAELQDVNGAIGRWRPSSAHNPAELSDFLSRVSADVSSAPRLEAVRLLIQEFADDAAAATFDRFAGLLLRAGRPQGVAEAIEALRAHLHGLKATLGRRDFDFRIWGASDHPPSFIELETNSKAAVRIGERLEIRDLIAGRLSRRSVYDAIHHAAEDWLAETSEGVDKVPCFWVEGRSGAGKSAALLHLLAMLHANDPERVIVWLGSRPERVGEVIARFRDHVLAGRRLIIALDDPLAPDKQSQFAQAIQKAGEEWTRLHGQGDPDVLQTPVIICCGPTEQREYGSEVLYAELDIRAYPLPRERLEDLEELAHWYAKRTGRPAPDLSGDVLLVQRFFEWNKGDIPDFARRFRDRLKGFSRPNQTTTVFDIVARILAFGRLYSDYPVVDIEVARAGDDQLARDLDQLAENDDHLTFEDEGGGVRLTHPHLADAIYREWFGKPGDRPFRKRHLADGLRASLGRQDEQPEVRLAPLWAIARLVRSPMGAGALPDDVRERTTLIREELLELLPELYAECLPDLLPLSDLSIWLNLDQDLELDLSPSPRALLLKELAAAQEPTTGLRLTCRSLLHHGGTADGTGTMDTVLAFLERSADWRIEGHPWVDWPFAAVDFTRYGGAADLVDTVLRLIDSVPQWRNLRRVVLALQRRAPRADAEAATSAWLSATEARSRDWAPVIETALQHRLSPPNLHDFGYRFLVENPRHVRWAQVWDALHQTFIDDRVRLDALALSWLKVDIGVVPGADPDSSSLSRVLSISLSSASGEHKVELTRLGLSWLEEASDEDQGWTYIWSALWTHGDLDSSLREELRSKALNWLDVQTGHFGWSFVFHALYHRPEGVDHDALMTVGRRWVVAAPNGHSGWPYVWETLFKAGSEGELRQTMADVGQAWLLKAADQPGWSAVWSLIYENEPRRRVAMLTVARDWLKTAGPEHPSWPVIAKTYFPLMRVADQDDRISAAAFRWLRTHKESTSWAPIFSRSLPLLTSVQREGVTVDAVALLRGKGPRYSPRVLQAVLRAGTSPSDRQSLLRDLVEWLPENLDHREWTTAWRLVRNEGAALIDETRLFDLATAWADAGGTRSPSWPYFWPSWRHALRAAGKASLIKERSEVVLTWLCETSPKHPTWAKNWLAFKTDRADLRKTAGLMVAERAWLRLDGQEFDIWVQVLEAHMRKTDEWRSDAAIVARVRRELDVSQSRKSWATVLKAAVDLAASEADKTAILCKGLDWLEANPSSSQWSYVLGVMTANTPRKCEIADKVVLAGNAWLGSRTPRQGVWLQVLQNVSHLARSRTLQDDETAVLLQWFESDPTSRTGISIWRLLAKATSRDMRRQASAQAFASLLRTLGDSDLMLSHAWSDFIAVSKPSDHSPEIGAIGMAWLSGAGRRHSSWAYVFRDLWRSWPAQRRDLRILGQDWLRDGGATKPRADIVQTRLFRGKGASQ